MFLGDKSLFEALRSGKIVIQNSYYGALNGMTVDVRLGSSILVPELSGPLDPLGSADQIKWKKVSLPKDTKDNAGMGFVLQPGMLALGYTQEQISIDRETVAIINSRSTAARFGIVTHHTAPLINPGHGFNAEGNPHPRSITLELFTSCPTGFRLYAGLALAQLKFAQVSEPLEHAYDARPGAQYGTDDGVMIPTLASLIPDPDARQGLLSDLLQSLCS